MPVAYTCGVVPTPAIKHALGGVDRSYPRRYLVGWNGILKKKSIFKEKPLNGCHILLIIHIYFFLSKSN